MESILFKIQSDKPDDPFFVVNYLPPGVTGLVIAAALIAAIAWNLITWFLGIPSSSSHALVGGIVGAVLVQSGWEALRMDGLSKVLIAYSGN